MDSSCDPVQQAVMDGFGTSRFPRALLPDVREVSDHAEASERSRLTRPNMLSSPKCTGWTLRTELTRLNTLLISSSVNACAVSLRIQRHDSKQCGLLVLTLRGLTPQEAHRFSSAPGHFFLKDVRGLDRASQGGIGRTKQPLRDELVASVAAARGEAGVDDQAFHLLDWDGKNAPGG